MDKLAERDDIAFACCGVCGDGDSFEDNRIVICDRCEVAVHQLCYGIETIPPGTKPPLFLSTIRAIFHP